MSQQHKCILLGCLSIPCRGKTGLIVIRDGDSPSNLAASFARVWQLDASTEARLTRKRELAIGTLQLGLAETSVS
eukprot:COSAG02_NODE_2850_length_7897_cov_2.970633_5_plen_75_part_00